MTVYFDVSGKFINPVLGQRHKEVREHWKPKLNKMVEEIAQSYRIPVRPEWYDYDIEYEEKYSKKYGEGSAAFIVKSKKMITVSPKFFMMNYETQHKVLQHELSHIILNFHKHTRHMGAVLSHAEIPLYMPKDWRK